MHISISHNYDATPDKVAAMLRQEDFYHQIADRSGAKGYHITSNDSGTEISFDMPAPASFSKLVGNTITIRQTLTWQPSLADGSHRNKVQVTAEKMPLSLTADGTISATGSGTTVTYDGDLSVKIPLIGAKIEREAEPFLRKALDIQAEVGREWLANH
ncbi:MAG: hypothetical protein CR979_00640 [Propionibacterium sp.]|nr:MAG: hypothetical protein CR979_00640 [Propionibacterium sp.]